MPTPTMTPSPEQIIRAFWFRTRNAAVSLSENDLRLRLGIPKGSHLADVMRRLEAGGLVVHERSKARINLYHPTELGARVAREQFERRA